MSIPYISKTVLAPGIILYKTDINSDGLLVSELENKLGQYWSASQVVNTESQSNYVSPLSRSCSEFALSENDFEKIQLYKKIDNWLNPIFLDYTNHYGIESLDKGPYMILKYSSSDRFNAHMDDCAKFPRTVSVSAYLNDEYVGGELEFSHFNISYKPSKGDVIFFSSSFPYLHSVKEILSGTRYAVVNWYRFSGYPINMEEVIRVNN